MRGRSADPRENSYAPRGMRRETAAWWVGFSPSKFDELVKDGRVSRPRLIDARKVWDVFELDLAFEELSRDDDRPAGNSWDDR